MANTKSLTRWIELFPLLGSFTAFIHILSTVRVPFVCTHLSLCAFAVALRLLVLWLYAGTTITHIIYCIRWLRRAKIFVVSIHFVIKDNLIIKHKSVIRNNNVIKSYVFITKLFLSRYFFQTYFFQIYFYHNVIILLQTCLKHILFWHFWVIVTVNLL